MVSIQGSGSVSSRPIAALIADEVANCGKDFESLYEDVCGHVSHLAYLRCARARVAAAGQSVHLTDVLPMLGVRVSYPVPSDIVLASIDGAITEAKAELRKALVAMRDYTTEELDAL